MRIPSVRDTFEELGRRFGGVSIEFRPDGPAEWLGPYRVRLHTNKNEREDYRVTTYGKTLDEAIVRLWRAVDELDR